MRLIFIDVAMVGSQRVQGFKVYPSPAAP